MVELLLNASANLHATGYNGRSILHEVVLIYWNPFLEGQLRVIKLLLQ
jgi:hypothetical protein